MPLSVPAFIYHGLFDASAPPDNIPPEEYRYYLSRDAFAGQLDCLKNTGVQAISADEWLNGASSSETPALLTFDDGHLSNYELAWPLLENYGFRATFFIVSEWVGRPLRINAAQLRELHAAGISIGSHGATHTPLNRLEPRAVRTELVRSKATLEDLIGDRIRTFAVPGGFLVNNLEDYAREAGYEHVFTSCPGWASLDPAVCRISITSTTPRRVFERLARGDARQMRKLKMLYRLRESGKRIVGVEGYERLCRILIARN